MLEIIYGAVLWPLKLLRQFLFESLVVGKKLQGCDFKGLGNINEKRGNFDDDN